MLGLLRRYCCCVVQGLSGKCDERQEPPNQRQPRSTRPERAQILLFVRDLPGIDFDTASDEEVLRALRTSDEGWQQREREFGPLRIQRAITTDSAALRRMVGRAKENAQRYNVSYVDPEFKRFFFVPLPRTTPRPIDLYCSFRASPQFAYVNLSLPSRSATSGNYRLALSQRGVGAVPARAAVPPPAIAGIGLVDIEKAWLPTVAAQTIVLNPPRIQSGDPNDIAHGTATIGVVAANTTLLGIEGVAPGAEIHCCPFILQSDPASDPIPLLESAITDTVDFLQTKYGGSATTHSPGHVILVEQESADGTPLEVNPLLWSAIQTAVLNDLIVVEPAGNGWIDLQDVSGEIKLADGSFVPRILDGSVATRSGAIIVAAGNSREDGSTPLGQRIDSSNYGDLVDCWAWGDGILTYDTNRDPLNPVLRPYTSGYGETSGAAAIVAGVIVLMQGIRKAHSLPLLNAGQVRTLLRNHGTHGSDGLDNRRMPDIESMMPSLTSAAPIPMS